MKKEQITRYYYIIISIIFLFIGMLFQSNMLGRKIVFLLYPSLCIVALLFLIFDKEISLNKKYFFDVRDLLLVIAMSIQWRNIYKEYYPGDPDLHDCVMRAVIPLCAYLFGKFFVIYGNNKNKNNQINIIIPIGIGLMIFNIQAIVSYYYYIYEYNQINRVWISFLFPSHFMNATIYSFYPLIIISLFVYSMLFFKEKILLHTFIMITGFISAIWFWVETKTRLPLLVFVLSIMIGVVLFIEDKVIKKITTKKTIIIVAVSIFCILGMYCIVKYHISNTDWYKNSIISRNGGIIHNIRYHWSKQAIMDLRKYPVGFNHTAYLYIEDSTRNYAGTHVAWTEFAYVGGIIPFIAIILWLLLSFKDIILFSLSSTIKMRNKIILILPFFAVFCYSCTESLRILNYPLCVVIMFAGMIRGNQITEKSFNLDNKNE